MGCVQLSNRYVYTVIAYSRLSLRLRCDARTHRWGACAVRLRSLASCPSVVLPDSQRQIDADVYSQPYVSLIPAGCRVDYEIDGRVYRGSCHCVSSTVGVSLPSSNGPATHPSPMLRASVLC